MERSLLSGLDVLQIAPGVLVENEAHHGGKSPRSPPSKENVARNVTLGSAIHQLRPTRDDLCRVSVAPPPYLTP